MEAKICPKYKAAWIANSSLIDVPKNEEVLYFSCDGEACAWWCETLSMCAIAVPGYLQGQDMARRERQAEKEAFKAAGNRRY